MSVKRNKRERGFTLIELISVIIILGILAAVITPKYFDMTSKAQDAAYNGALSEASARFNMAYASFIMETNKKPTNVLGATGVGLSNSTLLNLDGGGKVNIGDYDVQYSNPSGGDPNLVTMTLFEKDKTASVRTKTIPWPN